MKRTVNKLCIILLIAVFYLGCGSPQIQTNADPITEQDILTHLKELSKDEYMGRMPFGPGDKMTVDYLVNQCKALGLKPGNGGSFTQEVPMIEVESTPTSNMSIQSPSGTLNYEYGEDYVINSLKTVDVIEVEEAPIVFYGYGIVDEKLNWNDFEGVNPQGKIGIVLVNDPGFGGEDSTFFKGNTMTYYGRWTYKYEEADRQGLKGLLIIHETSSAGYPWFVVQSSWGGPQLGLEKESVQQGADIKGWIHLETAKSLFEASNLDLSELIKQARTPGFKAVELNASLSTSLANTYKRDVSENVVAYIEGSTNPEEYILYSAHWDHIGVGNPVNGDSIYNGALDNASGTGISLAIAGKLAKQDPKPERSIVFTWVTAEEQGLLGSEYYALNPTFPINQTVCNINIDGCNPHGPMKDFQIIGHGHSEMDKIAEQALKAQDRYVLPDQEPEKGYFFRSDHFNFAKVGIPALFGRGGYDHVEKGIEYGKKKSAEYTANNYHAPSDEYDANTWDMTGVIQDAELYRAIGLKLANSNTWPQWDESSEFRRQKDITD